MDFDGADVDWEETARATMDREKHLVMALEEIAKGGSDLPASLLQRLAKESLKAREEVLNAK